MLTKATISHYKSVDFASLDLGSINIIVGQNGSGKSNVLDSLYFLHDCVVEDLDSAMMKRHGVESIRQWSRTRPFHITMEFEFKNLSGYGKYRLVLSSDRGNFRVHEESGEWTSRDIFSIPTPEGMITSRFNRRSSGPVNVELGSELARQYKEPQTSLGSGDLYISTVANSTGTFATLSFKAIADEFKNFVTYSIYPNTMRQPTSVSREPRLLPDGSNLPSVLRRMTGAFKENRDSLIEAMQSLLPHFVDVTIKSAGGYYVPVVSAKEPNGDVHQFNLSQISDGTLRVMGLLTAFHQPVLPSTVAIEEPEQMIHPGALSVLTDSVKQYVRNKRQINQVFLTTHSPHILDMFDVDSIIWTEFKEGKTYAGRVNDRQRALVKERLFTPGEILVSEGFTER